MPSILTKRSSTTTWLRKPVALLLIADCISGSFQLQGSNLTVEASGSDSVIKHRAEAPPPVKRKVSVPVANDSHATLLKDTSTTTAKDSNFLAAAAAPESASHVKNDADGVTVSEPVADAKEKIEESQEAKVEDKKDKVGDKATVSKDKLKESEPEPETTETSSESDSPSESDSSESETETTKASDWFGLKKIFTFLADWCFWRPVAVVKKIGGWVKSKVVSLFGQSESEPESEPKSEAEETDAGASEEKSNSKDGENKSESESKVDKESDPKKKNDDSDTEFDTDSSDGGGEPDAEPTEASDLDKEVTVKNADSKPPGDTDDKGAKIKAAIPESQRSSAATTIPETVTGDQIKNDTAQSEKRTEAEANGLISIAEKPQGDSKTNAKEDQPVVHKAAVLEKTVILTGDAPSPPAAVKETQTGSSHKVESEKSMTSNSTKTKTATAESQPVAKSSADSGNATVLAKDSKASGAPKDSDSKTVTEENIKNQTVKQENDQNLPPAHVSGSGIQPGNTKERVENIEHSNHATEPASCSVKSQAPGQNVASESRSETVKVKVNTAETHDPWEQKEQAQKQSEKDEKRLKKEPVKSPEVETANKQSQNGDAKEPVVEDKSTLPSKPSSKKAERSPTSNHKVGGDAPIAKPGPDSDAQSQLPLTGCGVQCYVGMHAFDNLTPDQLAELYEHPPSRFQSESGDSDGGSFAVKLKSKLSSIVATATACCANSSMISSLVKTRNPNGMGKEDVKVSEEVKATSASGPAPGTDSEGKANGSAPASETDTKGPDANGKANGPAPPKESVTKSKSEAKKSLKSQKEEEELNKLKGKKMSRSKSTKKEKKVRDVDTHKHTVPKAETEQDVNDDPSYTDDGRPHESDTMEREVSKTPTASEQLCSCLGWAAKELGLGCVRCVKSQAGKLCNGAENTKAQGASTESSTPAPTVIVTDEIEAQAELATKDSKEFLAQRQSQPENLKEVGSQEKHNRGVDETNPTKEQSQKKDNNQTCETSTMKPTKVTHEGTKEKPSLTPSPNTVVATACKEIASLKAFLDLLSISEKITRKRSGESQWTGPLIYMVFHNEKQICEFYVRANGECNRSLIDKLIPAESILKIEDQVQTPISRKISIELPLELVKNVLAHFDDNGLPNDSLPALADGDTAAANDTGSQVIEFKNYTSYIFLKEEFDDLVQHKSFFKDQQKLRLNSALVRKAVEMINEAKSRDLKATLRTCECRNTKVPNCFGKLHELLDIGSWSRLFLTSTKPSDVTLTSASSSAVCPKETPTPTSPAKLKDENTV